jgi:hypothetical protein
MTAIAVRILDFIAAFSDDEFVDIANSLAATGRQ